MGLSLQPNSPFLPPKSQKIADHPTEHLQPPRTTTFSRFLLTTTRGKNPVHTTGDSSPFDTTNNRPSLSPPWQHLQWPPSTHKAHSQSSTPRTTADAQPNDEHHTTSHNSPHHTRHAHGHCKHSYGTHVQNHHF
jgi:hypothetical protein